MVPALLVASALAARCTPPLPPDGLDARLRDAEIAYAALLDADDEAAAWSAFLDRVGEAHQALRCVDRVLDPAQVGRVHALLALAAWGDGDRERTRQAFAASRRVSPDALPSWLGEGAPERWAWDRAEAAPEAVALPAPARHLWLDGAAAVALPVDRPVVWQETTAAGVPVRSEVVWPGQPTPPYRRRAPRAAWAVVGVGAGLAAGGAAVLGASLATWTSACRHRPQGGCDAAAGLSGEGARALVNVGVPVGASVAGAGVAALAGGGAWVGVSARPRSFALSAGTAL